MPDVPALPERGEAAEDSYVAHWRRTDDLDGLTEAVTLAMEARRPLLAARLVGLLPDDLGADDPAIERARAAARFMLVDADDVARARALEEAWAEVRRRRIRRIKQRMRRALHGRSDRTGRLDRRGPRNKRK